MSAVTDIRELLVERLRDTLMQQPMDLSIESKVIGIVNALNEAFADADMVSYETLDTALRRCANDVGLLHDRITEFERREALLTAFVAAERIYRDAESHRARHSKKQFDRTCRNYVAAGDALTDAGFPWPLDGGEGAG